MSPRLVVTGGLALALSAGLVASPAAAEYGSNIPPSANPAQWNQLYRDTPAEWRPQGTVVAASSFQAYPNGLGFYNYGGEQRLNNPIFGIASRAPGISADAMRSLMGPAVCLGNNATGECTLTLPARQWKQAVDESMNGGHCYGLASTASLLSNGTLSPGQFQPGVTRNYDLFPGETLLQEINRNMASQFTTSLGRFLMKPSEFVAKLRQDLSAGGSPSPYVGILLWPTGGHAVTPYAVHDRGDGQFDVAVWDNNYPDAARAIHVDTVNEKYQYLVKSNPSTPPLIADGKLGLVPVGEIAKRQTCAFCLGNNTTTVKLNPVKTKVPLNVRILNLNGKPLKGVKKIRPLEPWQPGELWSFPTFEVPKGKNFFVEVNAKKSKKAVRVTITAVTGEYTFAAHKVKVPKRDVGLLGIAPKTGKFTYVADSRDLGKINVTDQRTDGPTIKVTSQAKGKTAPLGARIVQQTERVVVQTLDHRKGKAAVNAQFIAEQGDKEVTVTATATTKLPKRAKAIVKYGAWSLSDTNGVKLVVRKADGKTRSVPMKITVTAA